MDPERPQEAIFALQSQLDARWDALVAARRTTAQILTSLRETLADLEDPSCAIVVTGSLGRGEANGGSDADWVLLVDGGSNPDHARIAREVERRIKDLGIRDVGPTGTFGNIVPSHELVHYIAGTRDTNENLTRRFLLLAESRAVTSPVVRQRVIRNVLARYVLHDRAVRDRTGRFNRIPHFLLNDVVRYWRTMASDYASKMWERTRKGWGTRNIKLRFSRKLLFVWGLLAAFSGELWETPALQQAPDEEAFLAMLSEHIREMTDIAPLDLFARTCMNRGVKPETARDVFSAYDVFLGALADPDIRDRLDKVPFDEATNDEVYEKLRGASSKFRRGVNAIFFDEHEKLPRLVRNYAVF